MKRSTLTGATATISRLIWVARWGATLLVGVAAAGLLSCGGVGSDQGLVSIGVNGISGVDRYEIRIFGAAMTCGAFMAAPATFRTVNACTPANEDAFTTCHIEMAIVEGGPVRMTPIPDGVRAVTILGFSAQTLVAAGCADGVQVRSETTSVVTITMQSI